jgi:DNA anti-recombination protein RmuC
MSTNSKQNGSVGQDPKIEAIKEIIFGDNIKEINHEFDEVRAMIREHRQALDERMNQVRQELEKSIQKLHQDTEREMQTMKEDTLTRLAQLEGSVPSKANLGKMFEEIGQKLQHQEKAATT